MKKEEKIYDKNGTLLKNGDIVTNGQDTNTIEEHCNEWYIVGHKAMWKIEQFFLENYKDGVLLGDFEKSQG